MGEPIPEEEREKIFERFYRIDKSRNRNEKRYGLGLAIAKSIVQKYKGNIEVDFKNGFTIFKVTLPN
jgi:signal transduction histidine kinase